MEEEQFTTVHSVIPAGAFIREAEAEIPPTAIPQCDPADMECQRNVLEHLRGLEGALEDERASPALGDLLQTVRDTISQVETTLESCGGVGEEMSDA